jgi:hypothetical protein
VVERVVELASELKSSNKDERWGIYTLTPHAVLDIRHILALCAIYTNVDNGQWGRAIRRGERGGGDR